MMPSSFGGRGALVIGTVAIIGGVMMVTGIMGCMGRLVVMRMRHGYTHAAMGEHQAKEQNHVRQPKHSLGVAEGEQRNNVAAVSARRGRVPYQCSGFAGGAVYPRRTTYAQSRKTARNICNRIIPV
ncbi:hypothetical protein BSY18_4033 (plasmid) [Blastomonas sp. RAC04]|nr:hypothetical protein BSY18_4033 [Blastomonas sp. RAC04]